MNVEEVRAYMPGHEVPRVRAQLGVFTVHPDPTEPLQPAHLPDTARLGKVVVKNSARQQIKFTLANYGISRQTLFPDLDGLAESIRWTKIGAMENPAGDPPKGAKPFRRSRSRIFSCSRSLSSQLTCSAQPMPRTAFARSPQSARSSAPRTAAWSPLGAPSYPSLACQIARLSA